MKTGKARTKPRLVGLMQTHGVSETVDKQGDVGVTIISIVVVGAELGYFRGVP